VTSVTDGIGSTSDANRRWTDALAKRLQSDNSRNNISVLNEALTGDRILHPAPDGISFFGPAGLERVDRDVLGQAGVKYLIVLLGLNDIAQPGIVGPLSEAVSAKDVIAGQIENLKDMPWPGSHHRLLAHGAQVNEVTTCQAFPALVGQ